MSTLLDVRSSDQEPLPLYSRHDPDSASIRSAAPSYVSDTPTYSSYRAPVSLLPPPLPGQHTIGLPAPRVYAPGFAPELRNRVSGRTSEFTFDISRYSVGARRSVSSSTSGLLSRAPFNIPSSPTSVETGITEYPVQVLPTRPIENTHVSGGVAAERASESTVYRGSEEQEDARRDESRGWNTMLGQMGGWEGRRRSWNMFRENLPRKAKWFGRRR